MARRQRQTTGGVLPAERTVHASRRGLAGTFVVAIGLVIGVNAGVDHLFEVRPELGNPTYAAFDAQWRRLAGLETAVGTLVLGDSSGRHGVDPRVLDASLGTRSLNLCTIGNAGVVNAAWQLEDHVRRLGPPERAVLVAVHDLWRREIAAPLLPWIRRPWGFWSDSSAPIEISRQTWREVLLTRFVPIYAQNQTLTELLLRPWEGGGRRIDFEASGFSPIGRARPEEVRRDAADQLKWGVPAGWTVSDQSARALEAMMELSAREGFPLYVVPGPLYEGLAEAPAFEAYDRARREWIRERVAPHRNVHPILEPAPTYPASRMQNADHVAGDASVDYTERIARAILAVEGGD